MAKNTQSRNKCDQDVQERVSACEMDVFELVPFILPKKRMNHCDEVKIISFL